MPATTTHLSIEQGATWSHGWAVTYNGAPIDATWTARSEIRARHASPDVLHQFDATVTDEGYVVIGVAAVTSSAWDWRVGVYDVEVENADATVTLRVSSGQVAVSQEVTRG